MTQVNWKDLALTAIVLILLDGVYVTSMSRFFNRMVTNIQGSPIEIDIFATFLTYFVLIGGLYYFIIQRNETWQEAMLLGWFVYFSYELTNKAILKNWNYTAVLIDGLWGGLLFAITTYLVYQIKLFAKKLYQKD